LEADSAGIVHIVERWLQIQAKWAEMRATKLYPDVLWAEVEAIFKARFDKQTYEIHWVADSLRPERCGPSSRLPLSVFVEITSGTTYSATGTNRLLRKVWDLLESL
jgi:hypothetical protein